MCPVAHALRCTTSSGKWIVGDQYFLDAMGKRGSYPALFCWDGQQEKPVPALTLKASQYAAHYPTQFGFCGCILKGETQSIPTVWENNEILQFDRGGHKHGVVHHYKRNQAVGCLSVPGEESWDSYYRAVLWDVDGKIVWLGPEGKDSFVNYTDGQQQVGEIREGASRSKACRWFGDAETVELLHPEEALRSEASGIDGDMIFGWISQEIKEHPYELYVPVYWHGEANAYTNLLPTGGEWLGGEINDSREGLAAGLLWSEVNDNGWGINERATIWHREQGGHLDLHQFIDFECTRSEANSIAVTESEITILGTASLFDERYTKLEETAVLWRHRLA